MKALEIGGLLLLSHLYVGYVGFHMGICHGMKSAWAIVKEELQKVGLDVQH